MTLEQIQQGGERILFGTDGVGQVGAVEAGYEAPGLAEAELGQNVLPHPLGSGGGQGDNRSVGTRLAERLQPAVGGAELMAPLGDAVGFVDGDEADVEVGKKALELGQGGTFGGNVEDFDATVPHTLLDQRNLGRGKGSC